MLIWGGQQVGPMATGGRYDPLLDSWFPSTSIGAPQARYGHTAVWTGSQMIVWGGWDASINPLRTGGLYDPVSDTWVDTGILGAPAGRAHHTAVWTGEEMIVWGGELWQWYGFDDPACDTVHTIQVQWRPVQNSQIQAL